MAAVLTGTPVAVVWADGADPAGQSVTIPADATAVYLFWSFWVFAAGHGLASVTLNSVAPGQTFEIPTAGGGALTATGVSAWYNPPTGPQTLDVAWDVLPDQGATSIVVFVKDGDTTAWRDADAAATAGAAACTITLTTVAGDLVIKLDQREAATAPSLSAGWTNAQLQEARRAESVRASIIDATGATQVCDSEDENNSSVVAISIPASGVAGPLLMQRGASFAFG